MQIEKLRLKGFIGIKRGLGLDEISIDFKNIVGLIAFAGQNGLGKSTVLENLHPFNTLASRSGALFNHVCVRDAEKELSFSYNGNHYRTLIKIDCQSEKSEGFIWKDGESLVNGKIRDYAKYMTDLFGSSNLFFNSVFCAQNAQKLSDMTTGQLKTLFAEFLRLDRLQDYEETAKQVINVLTGKSGQIEKQLLILNNKMAGYEDIGRQLSRARADMSIVETSTEDLKKKRVEYQEELDRLKDKKSKQEVLITQKANTEAKIKELEDTLGREQKDNNAELNGLRETYKSLQAEISKNEGLIQQADEINTAAEKEKEIQVKIDNLASKIDELSTVLPVQNKVVHDLETAITALRQNLKTVETDPDNLRLGKLIEEAERAVEDKERMINNPSPELAKAKAEVEGLQRAALVEEGIDATCQSKTCSAIKAINEAKERLPEAQAALQKIVDDVTTYKTVLSDEIETIKKDTEKVCDEKLRRLDWIKKWNEDANDEISTATNSLEAALKIVSETNEAIDKHRQDLATLRFELIKVKDLAAKKTVLEVAKSQHENVTRQMEENATKGKELKIKWENRSNDLTSSINDVTASLSDINQQIDTDIDLLIPKRQYDIDEIKKTISETETILNNSRAQIMKFEADLSASVEVEKDIGTANGEKLKLNADIADWTYLKNSCGKNGLQAMEIDATAPLISSFANDLLSKAFGPLFSVKLLTQNEEGKEVLDIVVINDDGEEVLLDNLSGGQKIWILMALRLAMTLLSKEKSGKNFESFFADEIDGPLDSENATSFIKMYQAFMQIGGFKNGYFISHKESCRDLADNILMFTPGKNPYFQ
jgi:exonuclease SbcC